MAGTRIYSPQLGDDISSGLSSLGSLFAPPSAQQLTAQQTIAASQAAAAQKVQSAANISNGTGSPADYAILGVSNPAEQYGIADLYRYAKTHPGVAPSALDAQNYALRGNAANTFTGQQAAPLNADQSRILPTGLASALGVPRVQHGVMKLGDDNAVLPGGSSQQQIVSAPNSGDDSDKAPKWGVIGTDKFGKPLYGYPPAPGSPQATAATDAAFPPTKTAVIPAPSAPLPGATLPNPQANSTPANPSAPQTPAAPGAPANPAAPTAAQPAAANTQPQTQADVTQLHGDDFLKTLDPEIAGQVRSIVQGRTPYPTGMMLKTPYGQQLATYVTQADPSFESGNATARVKVRNEFETGGPNSPAGAITSGNTAIGHLGELSDAAEQLGNFNTNIPGNNVINAIKNGVAGTNASGAPITRFNNALNAFTEEATKFYRGTGGTESDIQRAIANLNPNQSPAQLRQAIATQAQLMGAKITALQDRWHQGMGPMAGDFPIVHPEAQTALDRINSRIAPPTPPTTTSSVALGPGGGASAPPPSPVIAAITGAPGASSPSATPAPPTGGAMPTLTDPSQVRTLPSGTKFRTPDGRIGTAP